MPENLREVIRQMAGADEVPRVGYFHSQFGVFWLDLWTWGGRYCLYSGDTYWDLEPVQAAQLLGLSEDQIGKPFLYRFPPGLLVLAGLGIVVGVAGWRNKKRERALAAQVQALLDDSRYKRALEIMQEHHARQLAARQAEAAQSAEQPTAESEKADEPLEGPSTSTAAADDDGGFGAAVQSLVDNGIDRPEAEQNLALILQAIAASSQAA